MKDATDSFLRADDLCDVQDGTFTKVYEEYGLKAAENFIIILDILLKILKKHANILLIHLTQKLFLI